MNPAQEVIVNEMTEKARQAFLEIEMLVNSHRKANRIPTLGAADIADAANNLLECMLVVKRHGGLDDEAPLIDASDKNTFAEFGAAVDKYQNFKASDLPPLQS